MAPRWIQDCCYGHGVNGQPGVSRRVAVCSRGNSRVGVSIHNHAQMHAPSSVNTT